MQLFQLQKFLEPFQQLIKTSQTSKFNISSGSEKIDSEKIDIPSFPKNKYLFCSAYIGFEVEKIDGGLSKEEGFGLEKDLTLETGTYELLSLTPRTVSNVELCKEGTNSESSRNDSGLHT